MNSWLDAAVAGRPTPAIDRKIRAANGELRQIVDNMARIDPVKLAVTRLDAAVAKLQHLTTRH